MQHGPPGLYCVTRSVTNDRFEEDGHMAIDRREIIYKTVGDVELRMHVFEPEDRPTPLAAIVFFFGGGWNSGTVEQFFPHCEHLAELGMFAAAADYRVKSRHGVTPDACLADGKSAVRYLYAHAEELGIDPDRIAAGGGSATGVKSSPAGYNRCYVRGGRGMALPEFLKAWWDTIVF